MGPSRVALFSCLAASSLLLSSCLSPFPAGDPPEELPDQVGSFTVGLPDFKRLAWQIDCLEKQIDKYGSIVPKHADVWGQARMMMHRQEFERVMKADLCSFNFALQGAIATSDQAFLANAFGLQGALGPGGVKAPDVTNLVSGNDIIARDKLLYTTTASPLANGKLAPKQACPPVPLALSAVARAGRLSPPPPQWWPLGTQE